MTLDGQLTVIQSLSDSVFLWNNLITGLFLSGNSHSKHVDPVLQVLLLHPQLSVCVWGMDPILKAIKVLKV